MTTKKIDLGYIIVGKNKDGSECIIGYDPHDSGSPTLNGSLIPNQLYIANNAADAIKNLDYAKSGMRSYYGADKVDFTSFSVRELSAEISMSSVTPEFLESEIKKYSALREILAIPSANQRELLIKQAPPILDYEGLSAQFGLSSGTLFAGIRDDNKDLFLRNEGLDYGGFRGRRGKDSFSLVEDFCEATSYIRELENMLAGLRHVKQNGVPFLGTYKLIYSDPIGKAELDKKALNEALDQLSPEARKLMIA